MSTRGELSAAVLDGVRQGGTERELHVHLLEGLRALVGCDGAVIRPGERWPGSVAHYLDEDARITDGYVRDADRYRPGMARWCALSRGSAAFIDTELYSASERRKIPLYAEVLARSGVRSVMGCPLRHGGSVVALIMLFRCGRAAPFRAEHAALITRHLPGLALAEVAVRKALAKAGEPPPAACRAAPRGARPAGLPGRHARVLDELLTGRSEKEIASVLALTPRTVHKYTEHVFRAYGARSRAELMALFVRR